MSRNAQTFRQSDLTRALKAAKAAGVDMARARIIRGGEIVIDFGAPKASEADHADAFSKWKAGHENKP